MGYPVVETRTEFIELRDNLVHCVVKPDAAIALEDAKENIAAIGRIIRDNAGHTIPEHTTSMPVLVDVRQTRYLSSAARDYLQTKEVAAIQTACAIVVKSALTAAATHLLLLFGRSAYPLRAFSSETEALRWLQDFDSRTRTGRRGAVKTSERDSSEDGGTSP